MDLLSDVVNNVFKEIPPVTLFNEEDAKIIISHKEALLSITDKLVKDFYDVLFAHPATAAVFREGERPIREGTLRDWWIRTVSGPFNEEYWRWQAYVGVVHFRRNISNSMMMGMWAWIAGQVTYLLMGKMPNEELARLQWALLRLAVTNASLTVAGYEGLMERGFAEEAGADTQLIRTIVALKAQEMQRPRV
ncbi:MAG: protoglobin domain-containing protein [Thermocladium sp.]